MISSLLLNLPYVAVVALIVLGLLAMLFKRNLIKVLLGLSITESAVNLFLVATGYRQDSVAPIFTNVPDGPMALPTVQALTLTSIDMVKAVSWRLEFLGLINCRPSASMRVPGSARQISPRPCVAMKLIASGVAICAGMTRSPSFSRSS